MFHAWKTIYVSVFFLNGSCPYTYLTRDPYITINDVVLVPVGNDSALKPAIVSNISTDPPSNFPVDQLKWIAGRTSPEQQALFAGLDMRVPLDISCAVKRVNGNLIEVPTTREERLRLRLKYGSDPARRIVEERSPEAAKLRSPALPPRADEQKKAFAYWTQRTHLFRADEYICSNCHFVTTKNLLAECPRCAARMKKTKYSASWVDEAEFLDSL